MKGRAIWRAIGKDRADASITITAGTGSATGATATGLKIAETTDATTAVTIDVTTGATITVNHTRTGRLNPPFSIN